MLNKISNFALAKIISERLRKIHSAYGNEVVIYINKFGKALAYFIVISFV